MSNYPSPFYDLGNSCKYCNKVAYELATTKPYSGPSGHDSSSCQPGCAMMCAPSAYPNEVNVPNYEQGIVNDHNGNCPPGTNWYCNQFKKKLYDNSSDYYWGS